MEKMLGIFFTSLFFALSSTAADQKLKLVAPLDSTAALDQAFGDATKEFNSKNPDSQVELIRRGGSFQSLRNIIASHYAGTLPDFALINESDLPTLDALKIVKPLPEKWLASKKFMLSSKSRCAGGAVCSAPFQRLVPVLYFNREALFRLNQETDRIPTKPQQLFAFSVKLEKSKPPGRETELWGLALPGAGEAALARWSALGLGTYREALNSTLIWVESMQKTHGTWLPSRPSAEESTRLFLEQKAVVLLGALDQWSALKEQAQFKIGSTLPEGDLGWFGKDFVLFIDPASPRGKKALEFIDHMLESRTWMALFKGTDSLPVMPAHASGGAHKNLKTSRLKPLELDKIPPHIREEWATQTWLSIEQRTAPLDLKAALQKLLSTQTR